MQLNHPASSAVLPQWPSTRAHEFLGTLTRYFVKRSTQTAAEGGNNMDARMMRRWDKCDATKESPNVRASRMTRRMRYVPSRGETAGACGTRVQVSTGTHARSRQVHCWGVDWRIARTGLAVPDSSTRLQLAGQGSEPSLGLFVLPSPLPPLLPLSAGPLRPCNQI